MFYFDPMYLAFMIPGLILSLCATFYVKSTFSKYSDVPCASGYSGAEAARIMLDRVGVRGVTIEETDGFLSDHYDPSTRTLRLSAEVYHSNSLSAIGVACHEAGHAIQHAENMAMLGLRSAMVPAANIGSFLSYFVLLAGSLMHRPSLILLGAALFSLVVLFSLITLPVEWNASAKAKLAMANAGLLTRDETAGAGRVLNAAFMTYVASAVSSLLTLAYYLMRAGVFGGGSSNRD